MTARNHWDPEAGEWVAYRDEPKRVLNRETRKYENAADGSTSRCYLYDDRSGVGMVGSPDLCVRFDTKTEAYAAAKDRWPQRVRGCRIGAERVTKEAS